MCLQSAVLGLGVFRVLERCGWTSSLSIGENVILQTASVATATMLLAAGKPTLAHCLSPRMLILWQDTAHDSRQACMLPGEVTGHFSDAE